MRKYNLLTQTGALHEGAARRRMQLAEPRSRPIRDLAQRRIPRRICELVPESAARENTAMPLEFDGETITIAVVDPGDIALADKLRFVLAKDVELVAAPRDDIIAAINRHYGQSDGESADSLLQEFYDTAIDFTNAEPHRSRRQDREVRRRELSVGGSARRELPGGRAARTIPPAPRSVLAEPGLDNTQPIGGTGMFFYVVEEGQRVLLRRPNGSMEIIDGPRRLWRGFNTFASMKHYVAHPGEFLIVRFRDGGQQTLPGPVQVWFDPRIHQEIARQDSLQLAAKEAVVVYSKVKGADAISRRIVYGPALFTPEPGEWLHTFSWHASHGGSKGVEKKPNALVFQKLWLMPDQMYHDVPDVRTADDAVLTIRLMIFYELVDIERMLDTTHDPIGDFVNAATSDVVDFTRNYDFASLKRNTDKLNELETYRQLTGRAGQCGYKINKVVYRGYGAPDALQKMHDQAIEARTKLQLERATEQQSQELENYKLDSQLQRSSKRRAEQAKEAEHELELARQRHAADMERREAVGVFRRQQQQANAETRGLIDQQTQQREREHLAALRNLGVDLTAFLTQSRADRIIELRGAGNGAHLHLDKVDGQQ